MTTQNNGRPPKSLSVRILDKDYQIACPPSAEADLQSSAHYLDKQMKLIRRTGKVIGLERIAVMAGLNTAYELLKATRAVIPSTTPPTTTESIETTPPLMNEKLTELKNRIDEALSAQTDISTRDATHNAVSLSWPDEEENSLQVSALEVEY